MMVLKMMIDTCLFHDSVGNVADFDFPVYSKTAVGDRAIPNIMIAFPPAYEITVMLTQDLANLLFVFRHLCQDRLRLHFENQMDTRMRQVIKLQHFRRGKFYPLNKRIKRIRLKDNRYLVIFSIPSSRLIVPGK